MMPARPTPALGQLAKDAWWRLYARARGRDRRSLELEIYLQNVAYRTVAGRFFTLCMPSMHPRPNCRPFPRLGTFCTLESAGTLR